jgi:hypothetical protein
MLVLHIRDLLLRSSRVVADIRLYFRLIGIFDITLYALSILILRGTLLGWLRLFVFLLVHIALFRRLKNVVIVDTGKKTVPRTLKRIADREVEDHIAYVRSAFEVPFGALWFPGGP